LAPRGGGCRLQHLAAKRGDTDGRREQDATLSVCIDERLLSDLERAAAAERRTVAGLALALIADAMAVRARFQQEQPA